MAQVSSSVPQAAYSPLDFALVYVRDPEFYRNRSNLLTSAAGSKGLVGITDTRPAHKSGYSVVTYARSGLYGPGIDTIKPAAGSSSVPRVPFGLGLFSTRNPFSEGVTAIDPKNVSGLGGLTGEDNYWVLRIVSPPENGPQSDLTNDSGAQPGILTPRPHALPRASSNLSLSLSNWRVDNIISAIPGSQAAVNGDWVEAYIAAWESLATTHPVLGRKPALSLKFGNRWWGQGGTVLYLESVGVTRDYYERGYLVSAVLDLRFVEVLR